MVEHRSLCRLCAALCGIKVETDADRVVRIVGDKEHPISRGYTCGKGRALGEWHHHPRRLDVPRLRASRQAGQQAVSWTHCLDDLAARIQQVIRDHGPAAVGIYNGTAGLMDGTSGIWRALFSAIGSPSVYTTISVDASATLLVQERVSGHPLVAGQPDPDARMVVLIGMNPVVSHGQNFGMTAPKIQLRKWAEHGNLWVIDPRRTETAETANHHIAPVPGSEYALLAYLVRELLHDGADREFLDRSTTGIETISACVERFDLSETCAKTGLAPEDILALLSAIRANGRIGLMSGTGVSMARTANLTLLMTYALLAVTGSLDRPGGQWYNPGFVRNLDATGWSPANLSGPGAPSRPDIPSRIGEYSCGVLVDEIESGNLRALIVLGGNPIIALPETHRLRSALDRLDVLAVADVVETETVARATHVLPSVGQLERADLPFIDFLSPHQFVQYTAAVVRPAALHKPIWWMIAELARRLGFDLLDGRQADDLTDDDMLRPVAATARATFENIKAAPMGLGIAERPWGWVERHLADNRWQLAPRDILAQFDDLDVSPLRKGQLLLIPARQKLKLNSTMNDGTAAIAGREDLPFLGINPTDAAERGLKDLDEAIVESDHGKLNVMAHLEERIAPGSVSFPHGFEKANVGLLTSSIGIDRVSGMVIQSGIPVTVAPTNPS